MVYHSFTWWLFIDFQTPVPLSTVGSRYRLMQRMGITRINPYNQGHDEGIQSNTITCYTDTLIQDHLQWTISQTNKNKISGKGNPSEECLFSRVLQVPVQRKNNTLSGFAGVLPSTEELSLKIWPTMLCSLIFFFCFTECCGLLCLSNTTVLIVQCYSVN